VQVKSRGVVLGEGSEKGEEKIFGADRFKKQNNNERGKKEILGRGKGGFKTR